MASVTIQIPTGPIRDAEWCYQSLYDIFSDNYSKPDFNTCANSTRGTVETDFQTFCCDGDIIGWAGDWPKARDDFAFEDLSCCRIQKPQQGGIGPIPDNNGKTCTATAKPTPLASLAATNTANAQPYLVTYLDASAIGTSWTDWTTRATPTCFWVDTAHGVAMTKVTVRAAAITTLPPDTADPFYNAAAYSTQGSSGLGLNVVGSSVDAKSTAISVTGSTSTSAAEAGSSSPIVAAAATARPTSASTALNTHIKTIISRARRMSKRAARDIRSHGDTEPSQSKRRKTSRSDGLEGAFENGKKTLHRALRVSRGFERQKLGRRQKTAKEQDQPTELARLTNEVTALKILDLVALAEIHLYKALLKSKPISTAPTFPPLIAKQIQKSSMTADTACANVTARLFNSNPVKAALDIVLGSVHNVLNLPVDDVPRRKKRLRAADYTAKTQDTGPEKPNQTKAIEQQDQSETLNARQLAPEVSGVRVGLQSVNVSASESEDYGIYNARLAESSGDGGEVSSAMLSDDDGDEVQGVRINRSMLTRHDRMPSLSPSASPSLSLSSYLSPSPPPVSRNTAPSKQPKATIFLPTLSGGYWSGSEPSDGEGDEDDVPPTMAPRKNRRGQQERRAIWEKKFGAKAKHLEKQGVGTVSSTRDEGWDLKRGASGGNVDRGRGRGRSIRAGRGGGRGTVRSGANSDPVNSSRLRGQGVKPVSKGKSDEGPLHPSWEAKKKAKEKAGSTSMAFQGKKVIFD